MSLSELGAIDIVRTIRCYGRALRAHQGTIDRLNVFPVPDGDTGTNMARTIESVEAELDALGEGADQRLSPVLAALAHGSLMGARGNSGVILCQLLRGIADALDGCETVGPPLRSPRHSSPRTERPARRFFDRLKGPSSP